MLTISNTSQIPVRGTVYLGQYKYGTRQACLSYCYLDLVLILYSVFCICFWFCICLWCCILHLSNSKRYQQIVTRQCCLYRTTFSHYNQMLTISNTWQTYWDFPKVPIFERMELACWWTDSVKRDFPLVFEYWNTIQQRSFLSSVHASIVNSLIPQGRI